MGEKENINSALAKLSGIGEVGGLFTYNAETDTFDLSPAVTESVKSVVDIMISTVDLIEKDISSINKEVHNDRVAGLLSAFEQYDKAAFTKDEEIARREMYQCENEATKSVNALQLELDAEVAKFREIPKLSMWKKPTVSQAVGWEKMARNTLNVIIDGYSLQFKVNSDLGEKVRISKCVDNALKYINKFDEETCYMMENYNIKEDGFWIKKVAEWKVVLTELKSKLEAENK